MRAFILGNGPSLKDVDLNSLRHGHKFAMNRIHLHPSWEDGFRPTAWVFGDIYGNPQFKEEVKLHVTQDEEYKCWIKSNILHKMCNDEMKLDGDEIFWWSEHENIRPYQNCVHRLEKWTMWHLPHICNFSGGVNAAIQIGYVHYNITEFYLLGCDGNVKEGKSGNHFSDKYQFTWYGPPMVKRINKELELGHEVISYEAKNHGLKVVNLTPNSAFTMHEQGRLEDVL